jgi:membrane protease YdiL (CAAX protease family)
MTVEWLEAITLSLLVVAYNNLLNWWRPFHSWAYVPVNLAFAALIALITAATLGLTHLELGLRWDINDLPLALALLTSFALGAFGIVLSRHAPRIADRRVAGLRGRALAYQVFIRIPLGTAVTEELLFRGALFATYRAAGATDVVAALCTAMAFGLWHISPTVLLVRINDPEAGHRKVRAAVTGAVLFTSIAALGLTWLRLETNGLFVPIMLHAGVNSVGTLAAVLAARRAGDKSELRAQSPYRER